MSPNDQSLTRRQLTHMGLSQYQAAALTKELPIIAKQGNAYVYSLASVLASARSYLERRIQARTRSLMLALVEQLRSLLGNVVTPDFNSSGDPGIRTAMAQLQRAISETDRSMAQLQTRAAQLAAEHGAPA
ncbi:MAG: hypothetical protein HC824_19835 [Synechococcales cyanobacterium RM1_1_8]|nr:hypothetical protein [Synechococcales cyanobacterium RM1_1_8]